MMSFLNKLGSKEFKGKNSSKKIGPESNGMDIGIICWIILGIALIIGTFGLSVFVTLAISVCILIISGFLSLRWIFSSESDQWWFTLHRSKLTSTATFIPKISEYLRTEAKEDIKLDKRITGSILIDDQLQLVIGYILRDFINPWYLEISPNSQFIFQLQQGLQQSLVSISTKFKSTDWVGYLTTRLVEDIASHLRLFRESKALTKSKDAASKNLVDNFFDKEAEKEKDICRDNICLKQDAEKDYLSDLVEVVLYYTIPPSEFANMPLRTAVVEIIVSSLIMPLFDRISEPDYINSLIVWACTDIPISSELFLSVIKGTANVEELGSVKKAVSADINQLRSRDSGGRDEGTEVKQKIGSLEYLRQIIDARLNRLGNGMETDSLGLPANFDYRQIARGKLFQLPMEAILKNSLTLDHFLSYMTSIDCQHYVNLYLNIECWKTSVSERLCALELERIHHMQQENNLTMPDMCHDYFSSHDLSAHKAEADVMYEQYLSEKAHPRVQIDDSIVKRLILRLRSEKLNENWFDETQITLFNILKENQLFLPSFRRSIWYIRLLGELDLLKDFSRLDEDDSQSLDDVSFSYIDQSESCGSSCSQSPISSLNPSPNHTRNSSLSSQPYNLIAHISGTEIVREGNRSHAIYRVNVSRKDYSGREEIWHVFRRYSEFYDFHTSISSKFLDLASIPFPSKKMLNNLATWFLEKRMNELNEWIASILRPSTLQSHPGLQELIFRFLDHTPYQSTQIQGNLVKRVEESLVVPLRVGVKSVSSAVKSVPDTVINTVDGVVDGLYKKLVRHTPGVRYSAHPNGDMCHKASIDLEEGSVFSEILMHLYKFSLLYFGNNNYNPTEISYNPENTKRTKQYLTQMGEENIPLRIVLLLMDEVFDLRSKDKWFRRSIVLFLRQILKAIFGDIVNRRIVEFVEYISSPEQVAQYIKIFKESIWPNGILETNLPFRDKDIALRTKIAARTCMLASISDEFRAILGSQTTYRGILNVYDCVQWKALNKRLIYVLLNGFLETLFSSQNKVPTLLRSLNTGSSRTNARNTTTNARRNTTKLMS